MIKIVFTGPECSGKTSLSKAIAKKFNLPIVPEFARLYLNKLNRNYNYSDLIKIAKGQLDLEIKTEKNSDKKILICDTNLQVIKLWSLIKYSKCDSFIINHEDHQAHYILCYPDFKWQYDKLRENKYDRLEIFEKYKEDLVTSNRNFITTNGPIADRISLITNYIEQMI
ncbi:MAG: hypothetical protein CMP49_00995 [Flavobacteriales bacterium]|nr:hypothetical protein [Flavobacteriales bacterium]|tara:strand:+ start:20674 stop:21180 length:507 start_codon:yes stop_codon:yes gene_type:complete